MAGHVPDPGEGLVIVGCSRRKTVTSAPTAALEVYQGWCFPALRERISPLPWARERVLIISARLGLIPADEPIDTYEQAMTEQRAEQLLPECGRVLARHLAAHPTKYALVLAEPLYLRALGPIPVATVQALHDPLAQWNQVEQALAGWGWVE